MPSNNGIVVPRIRGQPNLVDRADNMVRLRQRKASTHHFVEEISKMRTKDKNPHLEELPLQPFLISRLVTTHGSNGLGNDGDGKEVKGGCKEEAN